MATFVHWLFSVLAIYIIHLANVTGTKSIWDEWWWTYDGISGPSWWGSKWPICQHGKYQSPIDISPDKLLYDPQLSVVSFSNDKKINGNLTNTGNDITLFVDEPLIPHLNMTGGPFHYNYHLQQMKVHFGQDDSYGSEHTFNNLSFPAELHILAYNTDLYNNFTQAMSSPNGLAGIAIFLEVGDVPNEAFTMIADGLRDIPTKGDQKRISGLPLNILLPNTQQYITYEGSLTQPGCHETVTWMIFNKPIYIHKAQLDELRQFNREGGDHLLLNGNVRPTRQLNNRLIRTNINYKPRTKVCNVSREVFYEVNTIKPRSGR